MGGGGVSKFTWYILLQSAKGTGLSSKKESPGVIFQFVQHMHARAWCLYTTYVTDIIAITLSNLQDAACGVISYVFYFRTTHVNKTSCLLQQYVQDRPKHVQNFLLGGVDGWCMVRSLILVTLHCDRIWYFPEGRGGGWWGGGEVWALCLIYHSSLSSFIHFFFAIFFLFLTNAYWHLSHYVVYNYRPLTLIAY